MLEESLRCSGQDAQTCIHGCRLLSGFDFLLAFWRESAPKGLRRMGTSSAVTYRKLRIYV